MIRSVCVMSVRLVSAFFRALGWRACRFHPTCSQYAVEALSTMPLHRAVRVSAARLARCHPLSAGGYDPLPHSGDPVPTGKVL